MRQVIQSVASGAPECLLRIGSLAGHYHNPLQGIWRFCGGPAYFAVGSGPGAARTRSDPSSAGRSWGRLWELCRIVTDRLPSVLFRQSWWLCYLQVAENKYYQRYYQEFGTTAIERWLTSQDSGRDSPLEANKPRARFTITACVLSRAPAGRQ